MRYFTSDTHFGHYACIGYCNRPWTNVADMEVDLLANINSCVKPTDTLYILGDFAFTEPKHIKSLLPRIMCPTVLIRGNHDRRIKQKNEEKYGFADVYDELDITIGKHNVTLSHYPFKGDHTETDRYVDKRPKDWGQWLCHGHVHTSWKIKREERMINVGVDVWGYRPISEIDIVSIIEGKL